MGIPLNHECSGDDSRDSAVMGDQKYLGEGDGSWLRSSVCIPLLQVSDEKVPDTGFIPDLTQNSFVSAP